MCHQFNPLPSAVVEDIARQIAAGAVDAVDYAVDQLANPEQNSLFPGDTCSLIVGSDVPIVHDMTWGFSVSWSKQLVFNTRMETASEPHSFWEDALLERRCLVPATAFFETHRTETVRSAKTKKQVKARYQFTGAQEPLLFLAGIYGDGCFSLITTEPDAVVGAVHDRMPLVLNASLAPLWLTDQFRACLDIPSMALVSAPVVEEDNQLSLF